MEALFNWKVYVNDDGVINCDEGSCENPYFMERFPGRRGTWGEVVACLVAHVNEEHQ